MKKVVLVGYMGSGKSAVSITLSKKLQVRTVEVDELIVQKNRLAISEIFETKGELFFRKSENEIFKDVMTSPEELIISTGGGTPCYYNNHELLKSTNCISIYLKASIETLFSRLVNERENRPLLENLDALEIKEYIAKQLFERSYYYNQAKFVVSVDNKTINEIVNEIEILLA